MSRIRVMIVDESAADIRSLQAALEKETGIDVAARVMSAEDAVSSIKDVHPDIVICSINLKGITGAAFLQRLFNKYPVPIITLSKSLEDRKVALDNKAMSFIQKPQEDKEKINYINKIVTLVNTLAHKKTERSAAQPVSMKNEAEPLAASPAEVVKNAGKPIINGKMNYFGNSAEALVAIGASTGGTEAIIEVVKELPANFPPVLVTQHMPAGFTTMYAQRLEDACNMHAQEAKDGLRIGRGMLVLAAGDRHMRLHKDAQGYYITSRKGEKVSGHIPSVDVLFESVASAAGSKSVGVILTGMGADGAKGLMSIRKAGGYTIGQDQQTSVVYGMPMVAFQTGAVKKQLPLGSISAEIIRYLNGLK